jgi:hypothetical protein
MRKPLDQRYASARDMRADVRAALEGRAPQQSVPDIPSVTVRAAEPATAHAATVPMPAVAGARTGDETHPKPTLSGTAVPIAGRNGRVATVAVVATAVGLGVAGLLLLRAKAGHDPRPAIVAEPSSAPSTAITSLSPPPIDTDVPDLEPATSASGRHDPARSLHAPVAATSAHTSPSGAPVAGATVPAVSSPPTGSGPPPGALTGTAPAAAVDPAFDPSHAYVEVGLVNAQGVRESAVRAALRGTGLAGCYRSALRGRGARATGVATLNLSIDENGAARSAIAVGADFLPGLARCVQGAAAGVRVPKSQVDSGGGTAEVTLAFKAP